MKFFSLVALLAAPLVALAQTATGPNAFNLPIGFNVTAGQPAQLTWGPTTGGTVTLVLRSGASSNLLQGVVIASKIPNNGAYTWNVDPSITKNDQYVLEIIADGNTSETNYSQYFVIYSTNTVASTTLFSTLPSSLNAATSTSLSSLSLSSSASVTLITGMHSSTGTASTGTVSRVSTNTATVAPTTTSPGSAPRATVMAGMLGMIALGALAL